MLPAASSVIGERYELVRLLDKGGMGAVWEARDSSRGQAVAIKLLHHSLVDRRMSRRLLREVRALERLDHEHVVKILGHGVDAAVPFIVMELLHGESLRALLEREGPLSPRRALEILEAAADGLIAAHAHGIVHRDVKPSNLFLCGAEQDLVVKVIDFGIATGDLLETASQSSTGFIGSPAYMSPEQARGEKVDAQTDVWSLAVVAFQILTGHEPFGGANVPDILQRICAGPVPLPSSFASGLPQALDPFFLRAFSRTPVARFQGVPQLVEALRAACADGPDRTATSLVRQARRGRSATTASFAVSGSALRSARTSRALPLAGGAVILGMVAGLLLMRRAPTDAPESPTRAVNAIAPVSQAAAAVAEEHVQPPPVSLATASARTASAQVPQRPGAASRVKPSPAAPSPSEAAPSPPPTPVDLDPIFGLAVENTHAGESPRRDSVAAGRDPQLANQATR